MALLALHFQIMCFLVPPSQPESLICNKCWKVRKPLSHEVLLIDNPRFPWIPLLLIPGFISLKRTTVSSFWIILLLLILSILIISFLLSARWLFKNFQLIINSLGCKRIMQESPMVPVCCIHLALAHLIVAFSTFLATSLLLPTSDFEDTALSSELSTFIVR